MTTIDVKAQKLLQDGTPAGIHMRISFRHIEQAFKEAGILNKGETVTHLMLDQNGLLVRLEKIPA